MAETHCDLNEAARSLGTAAAYGVEWVTAILLLRLFPEKAARHHFGIRVYRRDHDEIMEVPVKYGMCIPETLSWGFSSTV